MTESFGVLQAGHESQMKMPQQREDKQEKTLKMFASRQ